MSNFKKYVVNSIDKELFTTINDLKKDNHQKENALVVINVLMKSIKLANEVIEGSLEAENDELKKEIVELKAKNIRVHRGFDLFCILVMLSIFAAFYFLDNPDKIRVIWQCLRK